MLGRLDANRNLYEFAGLDHSWKHQTMNTTPGELPPSFMVFATVDLSDSRDAVRRLLRPDAAALG
jgi:hypothetical protein